MRGPEPTPTTRLHFRDAPPDLDTQHCLNNWHKAAACTRCAAACPVQAISVDEDVPGLDPKRCVGCGVCQIACPTDVFREATSPETRLAETVAQTMATAILLVCPLCADPGLTTAPVDVVVRHRRCLAALSITDLLAMTQEGRRSVWLDDIPCTTCPLAEARKTLLATMMAAQALLEALGKSATIQVQSSHAQLVDAEPRRRLLLDGSQPRISRRRLFGFARPPTHQPIPNATDTPPIELHAKASTRRSLQCVPPSRLRLLNQLRQIPPVEELPLSPEAVPFAEVQVDADRCSACGLCADFCPTAALRFDVEAQQFALKFQPGRCIDCSLCAAACPEAALNFGSRVDVSQIIAGDTRNLIDGTLARCGSCGAATAVRDEQPLCHSCRHGSGTVRPLQDGAGLMEDLFRRISALG